MAVQASVSWFARKLSRAIRRYATRQGVDAAHLALVGTYDRASGLVYATVGADVPIDQSAWFRGIRDEVRDEFGGVDPVLTHYYLVVEQVDDLETIYDKLATAPDDLEAIDLR